VAPREKLLPGSEELAEKCVQAARISSQILSHLDSGRDLAIYGFFDALAVFSSALILMMSSTVQSKTQTIDGEIAETLRRLLERMKDAGNMSARDYYRELMECKDHLDQVHGHMNGASNSIHETAGQSNTLGHPMHSNNSLGISRQDPITNQALGEQMDTSDPFDIDTSNLLGPEREALLVLRSNLEWDMDLYGFPSTLFPNDDGLWMESNGGI